jgi:hypothetical protein
MKHFFIIVICFSISFNAFTQNNTSKNVSVEKSIFGIQTGFLGVWVHNESRLSNSIALRSEIGLDAGIFQSSVNDPDGFILVPLITLEPRWYYNLKKRKNKSKRIDGNSGNYISLETTYHPDWFIISNQNNYSFISDIAIIPTWGIRRNIGTHFNYETGIGVGYLHYFESNNVNLSNQNDVVVNLHLRIGYRF